MKLIFIRQVLLKIVNYCWYLLAVFLVLFALSVSLVRGLLPQLDDVRVQLVNYLSHEYGVNLSVDELDAKWQAFGPELTIKHLNIPEQNHFPLALSVNRVKVKLDFWESLLSLQPQIEDVVFDDVQLNLKTDKLRLTAAKSKDLDWLAQLLLAQLERFSITNLTLTIENQHHAYHPIFLQNLRWVNADNKHLGQGLLYLDADASKQELLRLNIELLGDADNLNDVKGQVYLQAKNLDLGEWLSHRKHVSQTDNLLANQGVLNFQTWLNISQWSVSSGYLKFSPSYLKWSTDNNSQTFNIEKGGLQWFSTDNGWEFFSHDLQLYTDDKPWHLPSIAAVRRGNDYFLNTSIVNIENLKPLLSFVPNIKESTLRVLQTASPTGELGPLSMYWPEGQAPRVELPFNQLHWQVTDALPGVNGLTGQLHWQQNTLAFDLPEQILTADFDDAFKQPISFHLSPMQGHYLIDQQSLLLPDLKLNNADLTLSASTRLSFKDKPFMAFSGQLKLNDAAKADNYFPLQLMSADLVSYLSDALKKGTSNQAKLVWNGNFSDFPFSHKQGVFQAGFSLDNAAFAFQPDWPTITQLSLDALFDNDRMDIWVKQGKLLNINADGAHVYIPHLGEKSLVKVKVNIDAQGKDATEVMLASPLKDTVGSALAKVQVQGNVTTQLDLSIPIYDGDENDIRGLVDLNKIPVFVKPAHIQLQNVTGQVSFHNDKLVSNGLDASWFGQPLNINFTAADKLDNYALALKFKGLWQLDELPIELNNPLTPYYHGKLDWSGRLSLLFDQGGYQLKAKFSSNLLGTKINLPVPFAKVAQQEMPFSAELIGDNKQLNMGIKLAGIAEFWAGFNPQNTALSYYDLLLGRLYLPGDTVTKQDGNIQLELPNARLSDWLPVIQGFLPDDSLVSNAQKSTHGVGFFPDLKQIKANIGRLDLLGQSFTNLSFYAKPTEHTWRIIADSDQFKGRVDFYPDWYNQGLKLVASRLYIKSVNTQGSMSQLQQIKRLPPIALDVDDFRYQGKQLGHLELQGTPEENDNYVLQTIRINSPQMDLKGRGNWVVNQDINKTHLDVKLKSKNIKQLADILDVNPSIEEAPLTLTADINWDGAPYHFDRKSLSGEVNFAMGKGSLSQVSDKGTRIFSLFSLESLLRKLSLDFSDVFGDGLFFNSFNGTLQINNGIVTTKDTHMDAIAGNIKVKGFTDLATESLNYDISFVPHLASSVPTVVLLSTSAWTLGLGAFALTKVLEPVIEVISEIRFRLTGTMSAPKLIELERKSKEIQLPESVLPENNLVKPVPQASHHNAVTESGF